jgi:histidinol-phosphate aminotransferase
LAPRRRGRSSRRSTARHRRRPVLVDEAYFDYVTDPTTRRHIPIAVENPRVIVARTFSKAYGMAGLRQGYAIAHADTDQGIASVGARGRHRVAQRVRHGGRDRGAFSRTRRSPTNERNRNKAVPRHGDQVVRRSRMKATDCQANFMFVDIGTPAKAFREACRAKGVMVARDFPPFEKTHARITLGTMEEMTKAVQVFGEVLGKKTTSAAA